MLLVLTVGAGTTGIHSNLAAGLAGSIRLAEPRLFWLVPSASPDSGAIADLLREEPDLIGRFRAYSDHEPYLILPEPDDLESCRDRLQHLLARVRRDAKPGEPLAINPTSGTKQMSIAATLAALSARADILHFTTGERSGGVVRTGTERLTRVETGSFFRQRAMEDARRLIRGGNPAAAASLLAAYVKEPDSFADSLLQGARLLAAWQRLDYREVSTLASPGPHCPAELAPLLQSLCEASNPGPEILADLLDSAAFALNHHQTEEALARLYRTTEMAGKQVLAGRYGFAPPYRLEELVELLPSQRTRFQALARQGHIHLGLRLSFDLLEKLEDPLGLWFFEDERFRSIIETRNRTIFGHGLQSVEESLVRWAIGTLKSRLAMADLPSPASVAQRSTLARHLTDS